ncbi:hypothetical protein F4780DRAFT_298007 [Xylariomycetidae sp. FL0641]|nr:hypothetical protein F4780DRAFT_298007 [Xylariomycetidae sp. FL0641]
MALTISPGGADELFVSFLLLSDARTPDEIDRETLLRNRAVSFASRIWTSNKEHFWQLLEDGLKKYGFVPEDFMTRPNVPYRQVYTVGCDVVLFRETDDPALVGIAWQAIEQLAGFTGYYPVCYFSSQQLHSIPPETAQAHRNLVEWAEARRLGVDMARYSFLALVMQNFKFRPEVKQNVENRWTEFTGFLMGLGKDLMRSECSIDCWAGRCPPRRDGFGAMRFRHSELYITGRSIFVLLSNATYRMP